MPKPTTPNTSDTPLVNLNARVPKPLWQRVRIHCVQENQLLRDFITAALEDRLRRVKATVERPS